MPSHRFLHTPKRLRVGNPSVLLTVTMLDGLPTLTHLDDGPPVAVDGDEQYSALHFVLAVQIQAGSPYDSRDLVLT